MKTIYIVVFVMVISTLVGAQEKRKVFLRIQPTITKEKFYEKNELDANVLPIVVEFPVSNRVNLRFTSFLNYHFGTNNKVSDVGLQT